MRILLIGLASTLLLAGCAGRNAPPPKAVEELPPWQTEGDEVRISIVEKLLESDNSFGALQILRVMRTEGVDTPEVDLLQGVALRMDGVSTEAERMLQLAKKRMPRDVRAYRELCVLYADEGRIEEAIGECERAVKIDEDDPAAWNNLGFLYLAADRVDEAMEPMQHAVELDPTQARYRNNLALVQAAVGRPEQALKTFMSTSSRADAAYNVGVALERFDSPEHALRYYDKALQYDEGHASATEAVSRLRPTDTQQKEP